MRVVNIARKFGMFSEAWVPRIVGELNGQHVKLARLEGEFEWHHHEREDELFLVVTGRMEMHLRDAVHVLEAGEFCIVERGIEHKPVGTPVAEVLLFEPASTLNTGTARSERTVDDPERI